MVKHMSRLMVLVGMALAFFVAPAAFAQSASASVRVVHASPDAPAVDVYVDGSKVLSNVPFFTASDYLSLPAGEHQFQVTVAGQPTSAAVIDAKATVEAGKAYSVVAEGLVGDKTLKPVITADNLAAPAAGKAKVRVNHASPDAPAVDVKVASGPTLITNLAFGKSSDYLEVAAGSYNLQVTPNGQSAVVIDLPNTTLEAGKIYDLFAVGTLGDNTLKAQVTTPAVAASTAPTTLPSTGGEGLPVALFGIVAAMLIGGGFVLRRQMQ